MNDAKKVAAGAVAGCFIMTVQLLSLPKPLPEDLYWALAMAAVSMPLTTASIVCNEPQSLPRHLWKLWRWVHAAGLGLAGLSLMNCFMHFGLYYAFGVSFILACLVFDQLTPRKPPNEKPASPPRRLRGGERKFPRNRRASSG